jgi:hypothetical protein
VWSSIIPSAQCGDITCVTIANDAFGNVVSGTFGLSIDPGILNYLALFLKKSGSSGGEAKADKNYGAGQCTLAWGIRSIGCAYVCAVFREDPLVDPLSNIILGDAKFTPAQINAACGPGNSCPRFLTIEVPDVELWKYEPANILKGGCIQ